MQFYLYFRNINKIIIFLLNFRVFLERSQSARMTLAKASEFVPEEVGVFKSLRCIYPRQIENERRDWLFSITMNRHMVHTRGVSKDFIISICLQRRWMTLGWLLNVISFIWPLPTKWFCVWDVWLTQRLLTVV